MSTSPPLIVYNASAGSGKTFSLVKAYLKRVLSQPKKGNYKHLLAITFTNKAVAEMKERIIETLVGLSAPEVPDEIDGMLVLLREETGLTQVQIQSRAQCILKHLLHNYAQFSVETIDNFNHRIIRTFAKDLKLPSNFEVSLEVGDLVDQAVDQLIDRAGTDDEITNTLLDFALQKTDEDKSWDIALDLKKAAKLLNNENDRKHLQGFEDKTLTNFKALEKKLKSRVTNTKSSVLNAAQKVLDSLTEQNIDHDSFLRKTLPNHFIKLSQGDFNVYKNQLQTNLESGGNALYKKNTEAAIAHSIDQLTPYLLEAYLTIKQLVFSLRKIENMTKNLVPLATVHLVNKELELIKEEQNVLPITEFNTLIYEQIKDEPAPFIYERLGDRYRHFFIDEFQDTSRLQWLNLKPLIENALAQAYDDGTSGSLLLVGDAKQSIYRWRGGLPEQFIDLYQREGSLAVAEKSIRNLDTNYRSRQTIIDFNNQFFSYVATYFDDPSHKELYQIGNVQKSNSRENGYVQIEFVEAQTKAEEQALYPKRVHETITDLLAQGYRPKDICILTRRKKEGIQISEYLLAQNPPISVISEETLLLKNDAKVSCLLTTLQLSMAPQNEELQIALLELWYDFLHDSALDTVHGKNDKHDFFKKNVKQPFPILEQTLASFGIDFNFNHIKALSLYECMEYTIEKFRFNETPDAFLTSFMDVVFRFTQRAEVGKNEFLNYWEREGEKASISLQANTDAVSIMTVHKSKGLEFPVVLFPYANLDLYQEIDPIAWYPFGEDGFNELLIQYKKEIANYDAVGATMVEVRNATLQLDNFNLLYVTLTRAVQQLYVFANTSKPKDPPTTYNGFFQGFLTSINRWSPNELVYTFGEKLNQSSSVDNKNIGAVQSSYPVSSPQEHNISIVTSQIAIENEAILDSIHFGNILHDTMALIEYKNQAEEVLETLKIKLQASISIYSEIERTIQSLLNHPQLSHLFHESETVYAEREIITPKQIIRPDRINIHPNQTATIVDYKTGAPLSKDVIQINEYAMAVNAMGFEIQNKLIVYANPEGIIINKV